MEMGMKLDGHIREQELQIRTVEAQGFVVIDRDELMQHYLDLREVFEGRRQYVAGAEKAISYLFEALGEPGAGE